METMKKVITSAVLILLIMSGKSQGLIFDSTEFSKQEVFEITRGNIPEQYSLENRLPYLYPQIGGTCIAMSFTLARTIMIASELNLSNPKTITSYLLSPYYIYYLSRNKNDFSCRGGLNPIMVAKMIKEYGFAPIGNVEYPNYYPFTEKKLCPNTYDYFPPVFSEKVKVAKSFKIDEVYAIRDIDGMKYALSNNLPVIIAMQVPKSFENLRNSFWQPLASESKYHADGHAIVAIGYDDNLYGGAVRIANSWGENWADNGKAWIRYTDLQYWIDGAFVMEKSNTYGSENVEDVKQSFKLQKKSKLKNQSFKIDLMSKKIDFSNKKLVEAFSEKK